MNFRIGVFTDFLKSGTIFQKRLILEQCPMARNKTLHMAEIPGKNQRGDRKMSKRKGRVLAGLLALMLVCTSSGMSALADETGEPSGKERTESGSEGLCEHHPAHTDECGFDEEAGTPCTYVCDICGSEDTSEITGTDSTTDEEDTTVTEDASGTDETRIKETGKNEPSSEQTNSGSQPAENTDEEENTVQITGWNWIDEDGVLQNTENVWGLGVPGASEENPLTQDALLEMLPKEVELTLSDGSEKTAALTWDLSAIPEEGIWSGDVTVTATVDGTYSFAEGTAPIEVKVELGGAETYASQANLDANKVIGLSPNGTTINLFDYWLTTRDDRDDTGDGHKGDTGINSGHVFHFGGGMGETSEDVPLDKGNVNHWTGQGGGPRTGIVEDELVNDYPQLSKVLGGGSLNYLFDPRVDHNGKASFADVGGLLQVDNDGYYYYNSQNNFAEFDEDANEFILYNQKAVKAGGGSEDGQFFPFDTGAEVFNDSGQNGITMKNDIKSTNQIINHYFGMTMSTRFVQQFGGHTSEDRHTDVIYEFSGDDDVWIFIDNTLVADLGGIHDAASVKINFVTGEIWINNSLQDERLGHLLEYSSNTLPDNSYHTLDFFYLERGNTDSNMSLKYNLVTIPESSVIKVDQTGDAVQGAEFKLYAADDTDKSNPIATGTTGANGEFVFQKQDQNGNYFPITIAELYDKYKGIGAGENDPDLVLSETKVPDGYRSNGDLELRFFEKNDEVLLLSCNQWDVGAYAMSKVTATAPRTLQSADGPEKTIDLSTQDETPLMFAVVYQNQGDGKWCPVYGNPLDGWTVTEEPTWTAVETAVKNNPYVFQLGSSGSYQVEVDNLPGDIQTYYHICKDKENAKYTVAYYYSTADSLDQISEGNTWRIEPEAKDEDRQFSRVFSVNLYVPNIKNRLLIQKVDDAGNPLNNVEFSLYQDEQVTVDDDGNVTIKPDAQPYDRRTTMDIEDETFRLSGGGVFPTTDKGILEEGEYYLIEGEAPEGYVRNENAVHIVVDDTGVYADAGVEGDGITVLKGVGSIVRSMVQFAADDKVDTTLNQIKATLGSGNFNETGSFTWSDDSYDWTKAMHLQYANAHAALDYGPTDGTETGSVDTLTLGTDVGWSRLQIRQCLDHGQDNSLKQDLENKDITKLFSGTTLVRVENERSRSLTISKKVKNAPAGEEGDDFTFTLKGTANGRPLTGPYDFESNGTPAEGNVTFTDGQTSVTLSDGESITIKMLPAGAEIRITEGEVEGKIYTTTWQLDSGEEQDGKETSEITISDSGSVNVAFTNTYVPTADFQFTKTTKDGNGLGNATFALYRLECIDDNHDHSNDEIAVNEKGEFLDKYGYKSCWKLVQTTTSDSTSGLVSFTDIPANGEYRLVEIKVPDGYVNPGGQWKIVYADGYFQPKGDGDASVGNPPAIKVDGSGSNATYSIINYEPGELPFSGNIGIRMFLLLGGALMVFGAAGGTWWYMHNRQTAAAGRRRRRRRR